MLPIQRNYFSDLKSARANGLDFGARMPKKDELYQAIARHIGLNPDNLPLDILLNAIDGRNQEMACEPTLKAPPQRPVVKVTMPIKRSKGSLAVAIARPIPKPVLKR